MEQVFQTELFSSVALLRRPRRHFLIRFIPTLRGVPQLRLTAVIFFVADFFRVSRKSLLQQQTSRVSDGCRESSTVEFPHHVTSWDRRKSVVAAELR